MQENIISRYQFLEKASQPISTIDHELQLQFAKLDSLINQDLVALTRQGCPSNITEILASFNAELTRFRQFCEFSALANKSIVGIGGGFSAGKSSFINKLIKQKCLAVEVDPTTSMPAYVLKADSEQASIKALNIHNCAIELTQEEFVSLTHEEKALYGFQVALLLKAAFVSLPEFRWHNLAILDTPGYSKPEEDTWSDRTDGNLAREQLNTANYIVWVVSAESGTIPEADIQFLSSLNAKIPKLVVLSKADKKTADDIADICKLVKTTLENRGIQILNVVPYSRKGKSGFSLEKVIAQFDVWNQSPKPLQFAQNFKRQFIQYESFIGEELREQNLFMDKINKILTMQDEKIGSDAAKVLEVKTTQELNRIKDKSASLQQLSHDFFNQLKEVGDLAGVDLPEPSAIELMGDLKPVDLMSIMAEILKQKKLSLPEIGLFDDISLQSASKQQVGVLLRKQINYYEFTCSLSGDKNLELLLRNKNKSYDFIFHLPERQDLNVLLRSRIKHLNQSYCSTADDKLTNLLRVGDFSYNFNQI